MQKGKEVSNRDTGKSTPNVVFKLAFDFRQMLRSVFPVFPPKTS